MSDTTKAALYLAVGLSFLAFMVVDDVRNGRRVQKRDFHLVFLWPIVCAVIFVLGLFEFSRLTSSEDGDVLKRPGNWI